MTYDIIDQCSIRPAAALGSLHCDSGLAATLPRLCRPEPALADTLAPYPLSLRDRLSSLDSSTSLLEVTSEYAARRL